MNGNGSDRADHQYWVGYGPRVGAAMLDVVAPWLVLIPLLVLGPLWAFEWGQRFVLVFLVIGCLVAYTSMEIYNGAGIGKRLWGLRIAASDGTPATQSRLAIRWAIKHSPMLIASLATTISMTYLRWAPAGINYEYDLQVAGLILLGGILLAGLLAFVLLIGFCATLVPGRQSFHDRLAGTAVFHGKHVPARRGFEPILSRPADGKKGPMDCNADSG